MVFSHWRQVLNGILQGYFLGPLLFIICINGLADSCTNIAELYLYADNAKLFKHISSDTDVSMLQADILDLQA